MYTLTKTTKKLFFKKYLYKVAFNTPVSSFFRGNRLKVTSAQLFIISDRLDRAKTEKVQIGNYNRHLVGKDDISVAYSIVEQLEELKDYAIRVESKTLGIYFNDKEQLKRFTSIEHVNIEEISIPENDEQASFLLGHPDAIFRKEYSHKYKVTIKALFGGSDDFTAWASKYDKIKLMPKNKYKYGGHFYVADDKMLSLCRLYLNDKLVKIETLVTSDEI